MKGKMMMSKFQAHKDAPDEVWLQIGYGDEGEHTWAPHEIADDGIEEAGPYVRADRLSGRVTVEDDSFLHLIADGMAEADKAMRKFPQPNYVISKIAEEAGEVVKAAIHHAEGRETAENVKAEMRQLIAMLFRLYIEGDQIHGMAPLITGGDDAR